jgi:geranylgeranyl diphosphate synthase type I
MKDFSLKVDEYMVNHFNREPKILYDASNYIIQQEGKRQRPFIIINSALMFNGSFEEIIPAASAIEFLHNFTLVHDDIMDNDDERRGAPTVHVKYGVPMAILVGDLLFAMAFESVLKLSRNHYLPEQVLKVSKALVNASVEVCEGQALDLQVANSRDFPSKEKYYRLIELKTSSLFKACAIIGSTLGGANSISVDKMEEFGRLYGLCFQLVDDVLGVTGDKSIIGKPVGNASENDRIKLLSILGNRSASAEEIQYALSLISMSKAPGMVRAEAKSISDKAIKILKSFQESHARNMLINLTLEASTRSK